MEIDIVTYNRNLIRRYTYFSYFGFLILFLELVPEILMNYHLYVFIPSIAIVIGSFIAIDFYSKKTIKIGQIIFHNEVTTITKDLDVLELNNNDYYVVFSNDGFKGMSNYLPFLTIGAFTNNPGINTICFKNEETQFKYEVLVKSETEYNKLKEVLLKNFKK